MLSARALARTEDDEELLATAREVAPPGAPALTPEEVAAALAPFHPDARASTAGALLGAPPAPLGDPAARRAAWEAGGHDAWAAAHQTEEPVPVAALPGQMLASHRAAILSAERVCDALDVLDMPNNPPPRFRAHPSESLLRVVLAREN